MGARPKDQRASFTPVLNIVSDSDIERREKERGKEVSKKRKRIQRECTGIFIPAHQPIRTHRTPATGFPIFDPAALAFAAAANASGSRRAAAVAASLTITNMIASENDATYTPQAPKEKMSKCLSKASIVPSLVHTPLEKSPPPLHAQNES